MDADQKTQLKDILYSLIPENGSNIGNTTLRGTLKQRVQDAAGYSLTDDEYWSVRDALLEDGKVEIGRGKGGSVHRIALAAAVEMVPDAPPTYPAEAALYPPFFQTINESYVKFYRIKYFVSQITASQGSRSTGGKWTRPDVSLIAIRMYPFIPGKNLEVITFEVKPANAYGIEGLFEASAHSVFAHRSYLAVHLPDDAAALPDRLETECERVGVGLITFENAGDWDSFEILQKAPLRSPDPFEVNQFINSQISKENQERLQELIR
jgi:hypothetical protein